MALERYRIWLKNGRYETAVAQNKEYALAIACREKGVKRSDIVGVGKATSRGRLYKYPF